MEYPLRLMKFWELISAFREYPEILEIVLSKNKWRDDFYENYSQIDKHIQEQNRSILDKEVPLELTKEICEKCPIEFIINFTNSTLRVYNPSLVNKDDIITIISCNKVHDLFGPAVIEEIGEYGSVKINLLLR